MNWVRASIPSIQYLRINLESSLLLSLLMQDDKPSLKPKPEYWPPYLFVMWNVICQISHKVWRVFNIITSGDIINVCTKSTGRGENTMETTLKRITVSQEVYRPGYYWLPNDVPPINMAWLWTRYVNCWILKWCFISLHYISFIIQKNDMFCLNSYIWGILKSA
jgi:hypothetical protein